MALMGMVCVPRRHSSLATPFMAARTAASPCVVALLLLYFFWMTRRLDFSVAEEVGKDESASASTALEL